MLPGSTWREETGAEGEQPEPPRQLSTFRDQGLAPRWSPQHTSAGRGWGCWGQAKYFQGSALCLLAPQGQPHTELGGQSIPVL